MKPLPACKTALLALAAAVLAACASKPPPAPVEVPKIKTGEQMLLESQNLAKFGERWKQGQQKVQEGEELVRQGRVKVDEGQRLIEEGNRVMRESEDAYAGTKK
jgi:outer membrane biogenesis lipoprotein LolB